jgi:hypothetical protein
MTATFLLVSRSRAAVLYHDSYLYANDALYSGTGLYKLTVNVEAYGDPFEDHLILGVWGYWANQWHEMWTSWADPWYYYGGTPLGMHSGHSGDVDVNGYALMQADGNFVLYTSSGTPCWQTFTDGNPGAYLNMQDDGNLVVYSSSAVPLWALF